MTGATTAAVISSVLLAVGSLSGGGPDPIPAGPMSLREAEAAYAGKRIQMAILNAQVSMSYGLMVRDERCPLDTRCEHVRGLDPTPGEKDGEYLALTRKIIAESRTKRPRPLYATMLVKLHYIQPAPPPGRPLPPPRLGWVQLIKVIETRQSPSPGAPAQP